MKFGSFLSILLLFGSSTIAQNNTYNEVSIASPNAGSLGKFVDIPVSLHTGIPSVNLPIYSVTEGPLNLDISLSYHAGGLKVMEPASWVGAGWSLNAGGMITRTVQGAPDEKGTSNVSGQSHGYYSDKGFAGQIMVPAYSGQMEDWSAIANGTKDGEPDLFTFNFGNYSGKFIFRDDRLPVLFPEQDLKITADYSGIGSISSFTVITPDGVQYSFGKTPETTDVDPVEITRSFSASVGLSSANVTSSWFLNKITSSDGNFSINLKYVTENYSYFTISTFPLNGDVNTFDYELIKNNVSGVRLSEVVFSTGKVIFEAGTLRTDLSGSSTPSLIDDANSQARPLSAIQVVADDLCKERFTFQTDYFNDNTTPLPGYFSSYGITSDRKRLKLLSFQKTSCDGTVSINPTVFTYYSELVPRRLSFGQDFWGYYNGVTSNSKFVPTYTLETGATVSGANRNPSWPAMRGGALNSVTYPTGGRVDYEMEANTVWLTKTANAYVQKGSISIGYSSPMFGSRQTNVVLSTGTHRMTLSSNSGTETAYLYLRNSLGTTIQTLQTAPNTSQTVDFTIHTAGTYELIVTKNCPSTGIGATGTVFAQQLVDNSENVIVGGLRTKSITKKFYNGDQDEITQYDYTYNGQSTGVLYGKPTSVQVIRNDLDRDIGWWTPDNGYQPSCSINGCANCDASPIKSYYKTGGNLRPMDRTQGSHIGYNEVKIYQSNNGYEINRFYGSQPWQVNGNSIAITTVNRTTCNGNIPNFPEAPVEFDYLRGRLKEKLVFNQTGTLVEEQLVYPSFTTIDRPGYQGIIVNRFAIGGTNRYFGTKYTRNTQYLSREVTISRRYASGQVLETLDTMYYNSSQHFLPTRKVSKNSKDQILSTEFTYAKDLTPPSCLSIANCNANYTSAMSTCLSQYQTANSACGSSGTCRANAYQNFLSCQYQSRVNFITCRDNYNNPSFTGSFAHCLANAFSTATGSYKGLVGLINKSMLNPIEITARNGAFLTGSTYAEYVWSSADNFPVIQSYKSIPVVNGISNFQKVQVSGTSLVHDSKYETDVTVLAKGSLVNQSTAKGNHFKSFIWTANDTKLGAVVEGAVLSDVAYSSFEQSVLTQDGGWSFTSPSVVATFYRTGKKSIKNGTVSKSGLTSTRQYSITYWRRHTLPVSITGSTYTRSTNAINGWYFFKHTLTGATNISFSIGNYETDDLRLFPTNSFMTSYTHDPILGVTSEADINGNVTTYEYDVFRRLSIVKDNDGNVVKKYCYNYSGQTVNCELTTQ